jgi:hypothetical protein
MSRIISRAENWERAYEAFQQVNFNAFDYTTIKESLLDYIKLYFPEDFNDYIESSEFIAILELFAYVGELLAYRFDLNAHENLITDAQRKESVLRLAKLISYKASRCIPARGLVKITSVRTTEQIFDSSGRNLANRIITWNDLNNPDWREQFFLVMNRVLEQSFGTVTPNERVQIDDVVFELYSLNNNSLATNGKSAFTYTVAVVGANYPMELVPVQLTESGPVEKRPEYNGKFTILYGSDGLGDGSDYTGFFMMTKQGTLNYIETNFDGVTPNQVYEFNNANINDTDIWVNNIDPTTKEIYIVDPSQSQQTHFSDSELRFGEWVEVDAISTENVIYNTAKNRRKFEVETLANDNARLIFGDDEFADIPKGTFHIWYRTSANEDVVIPRGSVSNQFTTFTYQDATNSVQTFNFTFSLVNSLLNNSASEDVEHIRRAAPSVYYSQDRMVNGRDYNVYMLQDPTILKLRAINRTFAGDSKYNTWHDPRDYYDNVKIFGDDIAVYWIKKEPTSGNSISVNLPIVAEELIFNYVEPLLATSNFFNIIAPEMQRLGTTTSEVRTVFSTKAYIFDPTKTELQSLIDAVNQTLQSNSVSYVDFFYSPIYDEWIAPSHPCDVETTAPPYTATYQPSVPGCAYGNSESIWMIRITPTFVGSIHAGWTVESAVKKLLAHSATTKFWNTNQGQRVINYDTLDSKLDRLTILKANPKLDDSGILDSNKDFAIVQQELVEQSLPNSGLPDINTVQILPADVNGDGIPDNMIMDYIFYYTIEHTVQWYIDNGYYNESTGVMTLPLNETYLAGFGDEDLTILVNGIRWTFASGSLVIPGDLADEEILNQVAFGTTGSLDYGDLVNISFNSFCYFARDSIFEPWHPTIENDTVRRLFTANNALSEQQRTYKRESGRYPMNFGWFHNTPRFNLVDPAHTNIIDIFIVTKGYYTELRNWIQGRTSFRPDMPTSYELRNSYSGLIDKKMISDTVILHPGNFKILFGPNADPPLRAKFKVIRSQYTNLTDNEVKVRIVQAIRTFFDVNYWEFGETLFFTELSTYIHTVLGPEIDSIVIVPVNAANQFGDLFQIQAKEDELFLPDINTTDIEIVQSYTADNIRQ